MAKSAMRAAALAVLAAAVVVAPATARVFTGSMKANHVVGTGKADVIRLGAGADRAHGGGGADRILGGRGGDQLVGGTGGDRVKGGPGRDRLNGGGGRDRLVGGAANDRLNAADGRADAVVDGGAGRNTCRIDAADVAVTKRCGKVTIVPARSAAQGGGGGGGSVQPQSTEQVILGLLPDPVGACEAGLPLCSVDLPDAPDTSDLGIVGCTSEGFLRVTLGDQQLDLPLNCIL
jgi:RTX calcium-binding nonapeptide repeat (4 copies)